MLKWLQKDRNRILLTFSVQEADRLKHLYPELANSIFYWEIWLRDQYGTGQEKEIGIDNADYILQNYLKHPIEKMTLTKDENNKNKKTKI